jgi:glycosyltransferase involved in cell wall biosynthesis
MSAALERLAAQAPGAIVHLDDPGVALAASRARLPDALLTYAPHNIEHRIFRDMARRMSIAHRPFQELEWRKIAAEERRAWLMADVIVAVSEIDAATMRAEGARRVGICPNGSDAHEALPPAPLAAGEPLRLLFVGSLRYWPYAHALSWFVREALPQVRAVAADVIVDAVGEHGDDVDRAPGVVYHGRVPEVAPFYEAAHALVLPVFEGSGTRLKVVEAAMFGRPIISTALGVEGLPLAAGVTYLQAETAADFAAAVRQLRDELESGSAAVEQRRAAARAAVAELTWPQITERLADFYEGQITSVR